MTYPTIATTVARFCGWAGTIGLAVGVVGVWILTRPLFHASNPWQLVIKTGITGQGLIHNWFYL